MLSQTVKRARHGMSAIIAAFIVVLVGVTAAFAYWSSSGSGAGAATTGTLGAPSNVTASASGSSVNLSWTAATPPTGSSLTVSYKVFRSGTSAAVCGGTSTLTATSCSDSAVPTGSYTYSVEAFLGSWTATSSASNSVTIGATKLGFGSVSLTGAASDTANIGAITIRLLDSNNNAVTATSPVTVALSSNTAGTALFSTTLNGTAPGVTSVTIPQNSSSTTFYYGDTKVGSPTITASSGSLTSATQQETVTAATAKKLSFTSSAFTGAASSTATSGSAAVQVQDRFGNPVTTGATLSLASNSLGTAVFSASSGGPTVTAVTIPSGSSTATFFYGDTKAGTPTISATSGTLSSATQQETINPAPAAKLAITSAAVIGSASSTATLGPITAEIEDQFGNATTSGRTTVGLSSTSAGASFGTNSGGTGATTVTIQGGSSSATFYYGDTKAGTPTITVSNSGLTSGTQQATINAASPSKLQFTSGAVTGTASSTATTGPMTVQIQDSFGNPSNAPSGGTSVSLSSNSTGTTVFATSSGGSAVSSVTVAAGSSSVSFYYGDTKAGGPTITATANTLTGATQQETINAAAASKLAVAGTLRGAASSTASVGPATVQIQDQFSNPVNAGAGGTSIAISTANLAGNKGPVVYATSLNGSTSSSLTLTVPGGSSSASFYWGCATTATSFNIKASTGNGASALSGSGAASTL